MAGSGTRTLIHQMWVLISNIKIFSRIILNIPDIMAFFTIQKFFHFPIMECNYRYFCYVRRSHYKKACTASFLILFVSKTLYLMIIYHAYCLHKYIADGGSDKLETAFNQVFAHCIGLLSVGWNIFNCFNFVIDRPVIYKLPNIDIEGTEFFLNFQKCFGILDRRCDL